jgi:hypothetical protein
MSSLSLSNILKKNFSKNHDKNVKREMVKESSTQQASRFAAAAQLALLKKLRKVRPLGINLL